MIGRVLPDGPADRAGLRGTRISPRGKIELGDIIKILEGKQVRTANDLLDILEQHKAGDKVVVEYERGSRRQQTTLTLQVLETT